MLSLSAGQRFSENTRGSINVKHKFLTAYFAFKATEFSLHVLQQTSWPVVLDWKLFYLFSARTEEFMLGCNCCVTSPQPVEFHTHGRPLCFITADMCWSCFLKLTCCHFVVQGALTSFFFQAAHNLQERCWAKLTRSLTESNLAARSFWQRLIWLARKPHC